jgi:hypothetical protein
MFRKRFSNYIKRNLLKSIEKRKQYILCPNYNSLKAIFKSPYKDLVLLKKAN